MTTQTSTAAAFVRNQTTHTGDGVETVFALGFPLKLAQKDIVVKLDGVTKTLGTHYTIDAVAGTVTFLTAPVDTAVILFYEALSKHVPSAVLADPMKTKSTVGLADQQATAALADVTLLGSTTSAQNGTGVKTAFTLPFAVGQDEDVLVKVGGVTKTGGGTDYTLARPYTVTFVSAPASGTGNVTFEKTKVLKNVDDVQGTAPAFTTTVTRTNN